MKIIDTHLHFWRLANNINSWVLNSSNSNLKQDYLPSNLIKVSDNKLMGVVHVEAHDSAISTVEEIKWLEHEMRNHRIDYKHIAFVDLTIAISDFKKAIEELMPHKQVVGIRHILAYTDKFTYNPNDQDLSKHENISHNLSYLAQKNFIFDCQVYSTQLKNILPAIISSNVTTVVDHMLLPAWDNNDDADCKLWQDAIIEIAKHKNIYLKLSGMDMFQQEFDFATKFCLENFPVERLMYGSNYPVSCNNDYNIWINYLDELNVSDEVKEQVFYKTAQKLFKFN